MTFDFMADLDGYFCEMYANYDKICMLKGYEMPKMQTSERLPDGRERAYTLPASTMRLALQKERDALLAQLKEQMVDTTFSFSFRPVGGGEKVRNFFARRAAYSKILEQVLARHNLRPEEAGELVSVDGEIWKKICKGKYYPTKNLIFSLAIAAHLSMEDAEELLTYREYAFDFAQVKDTVVAYLLTRKIYNSEMVKAALEEYKVANLYLRAE